MILLPHSSLRLIFNILTSALALKEDLLGWKEPGAGWYEKAASLSRSGERLNLPLMGPEAALSWNYVLGHTGVEVQINESRSRRQG